MVGHLFLTLPRLLVHLSTGWPNWSPTARVALVQTIIRLHPLLPYFIFKGSLVMTLP